MSKKLELKSADQDSCRFRIELSENFTKKNYRAVVITDRDLGRKVNDIDDYVAKEKASYAEKNYVKGNIYDLEPDTRYEFYAYAQPAVDNNWFYVGSDTIRTDEEEVEELEVKYIKPKYEAPFEYGEKTKFYVRVKNTFKSSQKIKVEVEDITYSKYTNPKKKEFRIHSGETEKFEIEFEPWGIGKRKIRFEVRDEDGNKIYSKTERYEWINDIPDDAIDKVIEKSRKIVKEIGDEGVLEIINQLINRDICSKMRDAMEEIIEVTSEMFCVARESVVVGLLGEASGSYMVGGAAGTGVYFDYDRKNVSRFKQEIGHLYSEHASFGVTFGRPELKAAIKLVVFPLAEDFSTIKGAGVTFGVSMGRFEGNITNFDLKSVCFAADLFYVGPSAKELYWDVFNTVPSVSLQFGGLINPQEGQKDQEFKEFDRSDEKKLMERLRHEDHRKN